MTYQGGGVKVIMAKALREYQRRERFADAFYASRTWRACRAGYLKKVIYCERCAKSGLLTPGEHVHHKVRLTPENISDPTVALNWDNLELLCRACHEKEHGKHRRRVDADGHVELGPPH